MMIWDSVYLSRHQVEFTFLFLFCWSIGTHLISFVLFFKLSDFIIGVC